MTETNVDSTFGSEDGFDLPEKENLNELLLREAQVGKGCGYGCGTGVVLGGA